jgi:predicted metal-dependent hydrolase
VSDKIKEETGIVGWKTKTSSEKKMMIAIYDVLAENDFPNEKIGGLAEIIVEKCKVIVRAPFDKPLYEIEKIIQNKAHWILKKQLEYKEKPLQIIRPTFRPASTLPFLGKNYPLKIMYKNGKSKKIKLVNKEFLVYARNYSNLTKKHIKEIYEEWLINKALPIFERKVNQYSPELKIEPIQIIIKNLKNRWGSMTKEGSVNLNVNLIKAPQDVIDYIILHELCHLKIKEHSHHYWDLVHKYMPNYQEKIDWLKVNGSALI